MVHDPISYEHAFLRMLHDMGLTKDSPSPAIQEERKRLYQSFLLGNKELVPVPIGIAHAAILICRSYGINGSADPMYIANTIAHSMGLGDGKGTFHPKAYTI